MIVGPRFTALLLLVTGGLLLTAIRYRANQQPELDGLEGMYDDYGEDLGATNGDYNYCQAQRPSIRTYPAPKVRTFFPNAMVTTLLNGTIANSMVFLTLRFKAPCLFIPSFLFAMETGKGEAQGEGKSSVLNSSRSDDERLTPCCFTPLY